MTAVVCDGAAVFGSDAALWRRLVGHGAFRLRVGRSNQALTILPIPDLVHLGSSGPRQDAIGSLEAEWSLRRGGLATRIASRLVGDEAASLVFRKTLLLRAVDGWRVQRTAEQAAAALPREEKVLFVPAGAAETARWLERVRSGVFRLPPRVRLPIWARVAASAAEARHRAAWAAYALLHAAKTVRRLALPRASVETADIAIAVISPHREWAWGMDWLIDGRRLRRDNTLFVPLVELDAPARARFADAGLRLGRAQSPASLSEALTAGLSAVALAIVAPFTPSWETEAAARCLKEFALWSAWLRSHRVKDFVTYSDVTPWHAARNALFRRAGVRTVYLVDSVNSGNVWDTDRAQSRHLNESWCFQSYDLVVSWCPFYTRYQKAHPQNIGRYVDVGSLYADPIIAIASGRSPQPLASKLEATKGLKVLAAFDSSYHDDGVATYRDGVAFLEDLLRLVDDRPDLFLILKEKTPRRLLGLFSFIPGELDRMNELLAAFDHHPRCLLPGHEAGAAACLAAAAAVVSYPFTSTTALGLASGRPAFYYDPTGKFGPNAFERVPGLVVRGYPALRARIDNLFNPSSPDAHSRWMREHIIPEFEPYADGRALDRLRALLNAS